MSKYIKRTIPYEKSFASHPKSACLLDKTLNPHLIAIRSDKKYSFVCDSCSHEFDMSPNHIAQRWCPYCSRRKLCTNDCIPCEKRSFASHPKSAFLLDKKMNPRLISIKSGKKYSFVCNVCAYEFKAQIFNVTDGKWCKRCAQQGYSKVSIEWLTALEKANGISIQHAEKPGGEFKIQGTRYKIDGVCFETKTFYSFAGCFWHGCEKCYPNRDTVNTVTKKTMRELYAKTIAREKLIREKCPTFSFCLIWECEWRSMKTKSDEIMSQWLFWYC